MQRVQRFIHWFLPAEEHFFDHVEAAAVATDDTCQGLLAVCRSEDPSQQVARVEQIRDAERAADKAMRDMADALDRTFVTPLDREDLYALTSSIESVSDIALAAASQLELHAIRVLPAGSLELAEILARASKVMRDAAFLIRTGRDQARIRTDCASIERLEHDADVVFRREIGRLYATETNAIQLLKAKEFLETLEDSVDRCAVVARVLESILIKNG